MRRLGYERYGAQGGDFGALRRRWSWAGVDPDHVVGVHVNAATVGFIPFGPVAATSWPTLTDAEQARLDRLQRRSWPTATATSRSSPPGRRPWPTG